jgi:glycosyltransferase involved in cell wall biosynthesis
VHVAFDAVAVKPGSAAIALENLLRGWLALDAGDRLTLLCADEPPFAPPAGVEIQTVSTPPLGKAKALWLRSVGVRRAARRLSADAVVSAITASALLGAPCPHGVILHDLRHEHRPEQFSRSRRLARRLSYGWSFRVTDAVYCVSQRTRDDLLRGRPSLAEKAVVSRNGADHVDAWPAAAPDTMAPYALAFGQFANKNVTAVLDAWALFCEEDEQLTLRLVGMSRTDREEAIRRVAALGIADRVELMPWLDQAEFVRCFTGAALVVFPSDFEGFGLPAVEALRLRIPLVVSDDRALEEVTGGHAAVVRDVQPETLVKAMREALARTPEELAAGRAHTDQFRWRAMAATIREDLQARQ